MRKQMFKMAGVKNEKDFYKKFPNEEAFMAKHGKTFKAQFGGNIFDGDAGNVMEGVGGMGGAMGELGKDAGGMMGAMGGAAGILNTVGDIGKGFQAIKAGREARKGAEQFAGVSNVAMNASMTPDVDAPRHAAEIRSGQYESIMRPVNGEELFPINGVGTNVLARRGATVPRAQFGMSTQGANAMYSTAQNIKQQQSVYAPTTGEFAPDAFDEQDAQARHDQMMDMSGVPKQRNRQPYGLDRPTASGKSGFNDFMSGYGGQQAGKLAGNLMGNDGGSQLGGTLGKTAGTLIGGPVGGAIGDVVGKIAGGFIDTNDNKQNKAESRSSANMQTMANIGFGKSTHRANANFMQYGGEAEGQQSELQPLWGGDVQPISENPHTDGGETLKFFGDSHAKGGIGVDFGGNKIEAEGGEPAIRMEDEESGSENLVIYGDLPINAETSQMMGDPDAKGKKFKGYVNDIARKETSANRKKRLSAERASSMAENTKFGRLGLDTQSIIYKGADLKLKDYSDKKESAANAQKAINDTAEEMGMDPVMLAKGGSRMDKWFKKQQAKEKALTAIPGRQTQYAEYGGEYDYAADGVTTDPPVKGKKDKNGNDVFKTTKEANDAGYYEIDGKLTRNIDPGYKGVSDVIKGTPGSPGSKGVKDTYDGKGGYMENKKWAAWLLTPAGQAYTAKHTATPAVAATPDTPIEIPGIDPLDEYATLEAIEEPMQGKLGKKGFDPSMALNALSPWMNRGSDSEGMDGNQLWGEMYAMSHNQQDPVYAQGYQPELDVPYDISLQDQLNRNTSTFRGAQRMAGGNPAATAMMAAQQYGADQPVLAEQFRLNQAKKDQVYSGNRATLNDAKLKNIGIYDQQMVRQSQAKSNTKEAHQLALNSISDKYAKNKLENRTLKTYENMYNYRFGKDYRARNVNDAVNFEEMANNAGRGVQGQQGAGGKGQYPIYNTDGSIGGYRYIKGESATSTKTPDFNPDGKYGSMVRSFKKF
jgi:hypothetical protein